MRKLTDEELAMPDVDYYVTEEEFANLPDEIKSDLSAYVPDYFIHKKTGKLLMKYRIPGYLKKWWLERYGD